MFVILRHVLQSFRPSVFWASVLVFTLLNAVENLIHYSIGRGGSDGYKIRMRLPSVSDGAKIVAVMSVFSLLQGAFTCALVGCQPST